MSLTKVKDLILEERYQVMPPMSPEDRRALTDEIRNHGVQVNIEIDESMHVLDGHNRVEICRELGIEEVPTSVKTGMTEEEKLMHARALNLARRHLTPEQRHNLIGAQLKETPERSDRQIAKDLGVSDKTVGTQRKELERRAEIPHVSTVRDTAGREQPRERKIPSRYSPEELERAMNSLEGFDNDPFENTRPLPSCPAEPAETRETKATEDVYDVIVVDPPWPMHEIESGEMPDYPTMSVDKIKSLHIPASDNAHIFLWATEKYLPHAFDVLKAWGFTYVCTFVWYKQDGCQLSGLPMYNCEFCLYARKGSPKFTDTKALVACFTSQSAGNIGKPDEFYDTLRRVTTGRRLHMFGKREIEGFDRCDEDTDA